MLNLSVSSQPCLPGKNTPNAGARPQACETCGAPGGAQGELLEPHIVRANKYKYLCPLCHSCLHLDVAGRRKAGKIIWLPELSQEELNLLCMASFVALRKAGVYRKHAPTKAMCEQSSRLYKTFLKRAEAVEMFLGGGQSHASLPRQSLSTPTYVASLIVRAQRDAKLDAKTLAKRVEGLRLLPDPAAFEDYIAQASRVVTEKSPVNKWMDIVKTHLEAADAARLVGTDADEHFDATPAEETF